MTRSPWQDDLRFVSWTTKQKHNDNEVKHLFPVIIFLCIFQKKFGKVSHEIFE